MHSPEGNWSSYPRDPEVAMDIIFLVKMICDLSLWFGTAGFILSFFGIPGTSAVPMVAIVISSALCRALKDKNVLLRLLPLLLMVPVCLIYIKDIIGLVFFLPPIAYGIVLCVIGRFSQDHTASSSFFKTTTVSLAIFFLIVVILSGTGKLEAYSFTYFIVFMFSGVLMLRLIRHDEHMKMLPRLLIINLVVLGGCCAAILFFSSDFIYHTIFEPLFKALGHLLDIIIWLISLVINLFDKNSGGVQSFENVSPKILAPSTSNANNDVKSIMLALAVIVVLIFTIMLLRRLWSNRSIGAKSDRVFETRTRISEQPKRNKRPSVLRPRTPRDAVRWYYRLFLLKAKSCKVVLPSYYTTEMILHALDSDFDPLLLKELRDIYIVARYSPLIITKEDAKRAKSIYYELKKQPRRV